MNNIETITLTAIAIIFSIHYTLTAIAYILDKRDAKHRGY